MNVVSKFFLSLAASSFVWGLGPDSQAHAQSRPAVEVHPEALRGGNAQGGLVAPGGYALRPSTVLRMPGSNEMRALPPLQYPVAKRTPKPAKKKAPVVQEPTQEVVRAPVQEPVLADINESSQIVTQEETKLSSQVSAKRSPQVAARPTPAPAPDVDFVNPPPVQKRAPAKPVAKNVVAAQPAVQPKAQTQAEPILTAEPDPDLMADIASAVQPSAPKPRAAPAAPKAATKTALAPPLDSNSYARPSAAAPSPSANKVARAEPSADVSFTPPSSSGGASVLFDGTSSELSPAARKQLDALAIQYSGMSTRLQVEAYAGAAGDRSSDARRLSLKRGLAVRSYLMSKGVSGARIDVRALGGAARGNTDRVDIHRQEG